MLVLYTSQKKTCTYLKDTFGVEDNRVDATHLLEEHKTQTDAHGFDCNRTTESCPQVYFIFTNLAICFIQLINFRYMIVFFATQPLD